MSSGITVDDQCKSAFQELKVTHDYKFVLFKISDDNKSIIVDTTSLGPYEDLEKVEPEEKDAKLAARKAAKELLAQKPELEIYETFVGKLPEQECRYAVYDFAYQKDGSDRNKILFYAWSPDTAKIKNKMVYASSKDSLRKSLVGIALDVQATDLEEVSYESALEKVLRTAR
ncbi:cofilin [Coemansia sp. RSA 376]|nr:cofilin [Coemansia sp. S680]KAJ2038527.1 cofilin [Coemansia sp. S3946]KAJ2051585.1 cofilin [Coemansia sp. S16]KAJ2100237.1 cofilin [Coemansia sp. RSA 922]KAJ2245608.1 cofilin [Coemansia sp. RSA 455]KAJ2261870.1 cofilin [Coemansia sp. RSA 376]KAJ2467449.1 cofilin [Coemansia sp. RSA 2337]